MGISDPGHRPKLDIVLREIVRSYTYVIIWMSVSIAVIMFNKWLLAYSGFPFPIALTLWHMAFCSTVGFIAVRVLGLVKSHNMSAREYATRVMPIGVLYAGSLWLSNSSYLYLSVSFIQMTKSLMPGLVYASGCVVGTEQFKPAVALNMALIAAGVVVCALGEMNLVMIGVIEQLTALGFEAMRLTLVQVLVNSKGYNMNPMQSLYYVSPACLISLLLPFCVVEYPRIVAAQAAHKVHFSAPVMLANALSAFALNLAVFLLIGKTSALTMNIAGVIKDWMLIFFSFYVFKAPVTMLNLTGYIFCCSGVVVYNHMKLKAIKSKVAQQAGKGEQCSPKLSDLERPLLQKRTKDDIMDEIQRLQQEMQAANGRIGSLSSINTARASYGNNGSPSWGGGVLEHRSSPAATSTVEGSAARL